MSGGDRGGDFTVELDKEKEEAEPRPKNCLRTRKAEISQLKKEMQEASSNGNGASSADLIQALEKRTQAEKDLAERVLRNWAEA